MKLEISLGMECNAACIFCQSTKAVNKNAMSTETAKECLAKHFKNGFREIAFTGGEPTIRKDIFYLIEYAKKLGYKNVEVKTNLFLLSYPSFVKKLEDSGLDSISFSVFGLGNKIYSKITGVNKSYSYLIKALKNLKHSNLSLTANILVSKYSYKDISKIVSLLLNYKIRSFWFWYISTNELKGDNWDLLPSFSLFRKNIFSSIKILICNGIKDIKILHMPPCILGDYAKYYFNERQEDITLVDLKSSFNIKDESFADLIKTNQCKFCNKNKLCAGVRKDYYEKFGDKEFKPLIEK